MSASEAMAPARRRPIPGMTPAPAAAPSPGPVSQSEAAGPQQAGAPAAPPAPAAPSRRDRGSSRRVAAATKAAARGGGAVGETGTRERRPAADYAATRLVNFRIPVDLHDRFRALVREAAEEHPRLRHLSLTEVIIGLLEEGPSTPEEIAGVIRRKRADEHRA